MKLTLRKARILADLKQSEVAKSLGVTEQTVSTWENGLVYPTIDKVIKMAKLYNMPIQDLDFNVEEKQK